MATKKISIFTNIGTQTPTELYTNQQSLTLKHDGVPLKLKHNHGIRYMYIHTHTRTCHLLFGGLHSWEAHNGGRARHAGGKRGTGRRLQHDVAPRHAGVGDDGAEPCTPTKQAGQRSADEGRRCHRSWRCGGGAVLLLLQREVGGVDEDVGLGGYGEWDAGAARQEEDGALAGEGGVDDCHELLLRLVECGHSRDGGRLVGGGRGAGGELGAGRSRCVWGGGGKHVFTHAYVVQDYVLLQEAIHKFPVIHCMFTVLYTNKNE